jgi:predicted amidohydrolase
MKICVAQTRYITGEIEQNIERHKVFMATAVAHHADIIIFPELSLTGYEPTLAQALVIQQDDRRLDIFQTLADVGQIVIGVGAPTQNQPRPYLHQLDHFPATEAQANLFKAIL